MPRCMLPYSAEKRTQAMEQGLLKPAGSTKLEERKETAFHSQVADLHHARAHVPVAAPEEQTEAVRPDLRGAAHEDDILPLAGVLAALAAVAERLVLKGRDEELAGSPLDDLRRLVLVEDDVAGSVVSVRYPPCSEVSDRLKPNAGTSGCTETAAYLGWPRRRNGASHRSPAGPCASLPPA